MDLIYADENRIDLGVLQDYKFDLAYGESENDFECTVLLDNNPCQQDYILYIEGTEYGGIIDSIAPDPDNNKLAYKGRTWHGVLNSKVLEPDAGYDYLTVYGDANEVVLELIERMNLTDTFFVSGDLSGIEVRNYQFRYENGYDGIRKMLQSYHAKLCMKWQGNKVLLWCELLCDYSIDEEFDTSQVSFSMQKNFNLCNHIICLGQGDLKDRHVIHIFSNENGGILPYALTDNPMQDSDYILDKRSQSLFGSAEIAEAYDFSSAETIENYLPLPNEPPDWKQDYTKYFQISDGSYKEIERNLQDVYVLQTVQPWNWNSNYKDYFYLSNGEYNNVESESKTTYVLLTKQPSDWAANYKDYFEVKENEYAAVDSVTIETYKKQTKQPNDWDKNYGNYYVTDGIDYSQCSADSKEVYNLQVRQPSDWKHTYKDTYCIYFNGKYVKCGDLAIYKKKAPKWRKNTFYNKGSKEVPPKWGAKTRYTKETKVVAPNWKANKYYMKVVTDFPTWTQNKYYTCQKDVDVGVEFAPNAYYEKVLDHYKTMVDGAIERFAEYYASDELEISLDTEKMYDIGDIVGAFENNTGIFVAQPITKKIVTIERDKESIRYEVKKNGS